MPLITDEQLKHEVVLLFGPKMSAADAVKALRRLAAEIEKAGLLIGRDEDGDFLNERVDGRVA